MLCPPPPFLSPLPLLQSHPESFHLHQEHHLLYVWLVDRLLTTSRNKYYCRLRHYLLQCGATSSLTAKTIYEIMEGCKKPPELGDIPIPLVVLNCQDFLLQPVCTTVDGSGSYCVWLSELGIVTATKEMAYHHGTSTATRGGKAASTTTTNTEGKDYIHSVVDYLKQAGAVDRSSALRLATLCNRVPMTPPPTATCPSSPPSTPTSQVCCPPPSPTTASRTISRRPRGSTLLRSSPYFIIDPVSDKKGNIIAHTIYLSPLGVSSTITATNTTSSLTTTCHDYVTRVSNFLEGLGAVERSRAAKLAEVGVRFPLPSLLEGAKVSDVLRRCGWFKIERNMVDGVNSGHVIWVEKKPGVCGSER